MYLIFLSMDSLIAEMEVQKYIKALLEDPVALEPFIEKQLQLIPLIYKLRASAKTYKKGKEMLNMDSTKPQEKKPQEEDYEEPDSELVIKCSIEQALGHIRHFYEVFIPGSIAYDRFKANPRCVALDDLPKDLRRGICPIIIEYGFSIGEEEFVDKQKQHWIEIAKVLKKIETRFSLEPVEIFDMETKEHKHFSPFIHIYIGLYELVHGTLSYKPYGDKDFPWFDLDRMDTMFEGVQHDSPFCASFLSPDEEDQYEKLIWKWDEVFNMEDTSAWIESL